MERTPQPLLVPVALVARPWQGDVKTSWRGKKLREPWRRELIDRAGVADRMLIGAFRRF